MHRDIHTIRHSGVLRTLVSPSLLLSTMERNQDAITGLSSPKAHPGSGTSTASSAGIPGAQFGHALGSLFA